MKLHEFPVVIEQDEDGFFVASVPSIPGCHTQGKTYEETIKRVKEAIELCLEVAEDNPSYKSKISPPSKFIGVSNVAVEV